MATVGLWNGGEMIIGVVLQLLFVALFIFGIYRIFARGSRKSSGEFSIRRLFQYALLYLSLVITGVGIGGLLGRILDTSQVIAESRTDLARNLSFTIVGVPLLYGFARWTNRALTSDPNESRSFSFNAYLTIASITALSVSLYGLHDFLSWAIGSDPYRGDSLAQLLVWSAIWAAHWRIERKRSVEGEREPHLLIGSGIGLVLLAVGIGGLVGNVIEKLMNLNDEVTILQRTDPVINSVITIFLGALVWYFYWIRNALNSTRELIWSAYVLLAGIAVSFITAVVSLSVVGYDILVWFFGDTNNAPFVKHFFGSANAVGSAAISLGIWWYHRLVLEPVDARGIQVRTELRRVYEYIISGISLIASSLGIVMIIVAAIESVTPSELAEGSGGTNSLILALTLLLVGAPIWWFFWRRIEDQAITSNEEVASPTRRIFLLMLFGVSGLAAVISVITSVFLLLDDWLNSELALETLRSARFAIAILLANGALAGYHWSIFRHERSVAVKGWGRGRKIVLVGPSDSEIVRELRHRVAGSVELWPTQNGDGRWSVDDLVSLIESNDGQSLLILNEKSKLRAVEVRH
jgi:hypothetical protein